MFLQFWLKFYSLHDNKAHCKQLLHSLKEEQRILLHSFSECNIVFLLCIYLHFLLYCRLFTKILVVHSSLKYMDHILFQMFLIRCYQLNLLFGNLSIIYFPFFFFFFVKQAVTNIISQWFYRQFLLIAYYSRDVFLCSPQKRFISDIIEIQLVLLTYLSPPYLILATYCIKVDLLIIFQ